MPANRIQSRVHVDEIRFHLDWIDPFATADTFANLFGVTNNAIHTHLRRKHREDLRDRLHRNKNRHDPHGFDKGRKQVAA